jgi:hypothetical protein
MPMRLSRLLHVSLVSPFYIPYSPRKRNARLVQLQLSLHIATVWDNFPPHATLCCAYHDMV